MRASRLLRTASLLFAFALCRVFAAEAPQSVIQSKLLQVDNAPVQNLGTILANPLDQLAVRTEAGADIDSIKKLIEEQGGILDKLIELPDDAGGGHLISASHPAAAAEKLRSTVGSASGVQYTEYIWCRKFLPGGESLALASNAGAVPMVGSIEGLPLDAIGPATKILVGPTPPSVESFLGGESLPWTSEGPSLSSPISTGGTGNEFHSVPRGGSTVTREVRLGWECYTIRIPIETPPETPTSTPPPEEYDGGSCSDPDISKLAGPKPKVKVIHPDEKDFRYPRPIPLQAKIRDWDELKIVCEGCGGGKSEEIMYLRDAIKTGSYKWTLTGKGSLNQPFGNEIDWDQIVADLEAQIAAVESSIGDLQSKKDDLDASRDQRRAEIDRQIQELERRKQELQRELDAQDKKIAELEKRIADKQAEIDALKEEITKLEEDIKKKFEEIQELQDKINGEPSPEEQRLMAELDALKKRIEAKRQEIAQQEARAVSEEASLRQAYNQAINALNDARNELARIRRDVKATQDRITALERQLFTSTALRDFTAQRSQILMESLNLRSRYFPDLPEAPAAQTLGQAMDAIRAPGSQQGGLVQRFTQTRDTLLSDMREACAASADPGGCNNEVNDFEKELDELSDTVSQATSEPMVDPDVWKKLQQAKADLANLNNSAVAAEAAVNAAEQAATAAQQTYLDGLDRLAEEAARLEDELAALLDEEFNLSIELKKAQVAAGIERERMTPQWLNEVEQLRQEVQDLYVQINEKRQQMSDKVDERTDLEEERDQEVSVKERIEGSIRRIDSRIAALEAEKRALDSETEEIEQQIADLNSELGELNEELARAREEAARANARMNGNKTVTGTPLVWYIPPPLEDIMKNKTRFEELKKDVAEKEGKYKGAVEKKATLQKEAFDIIKGMNEQLWALKNASETVSSLDDEIKGLNVDKGAAETRYNAENQQNLRDKEAAKAEAQQEKNQKDQKLQEAERKEQEKQEQVDSAKGTVEEKERAVTEKENNVFAKIEGYQIDRRARQAKGERLAEQRSQHEETKSRLRNKEAELQRISDRLSRALSTDNEAAAEGLRSQVEAVAGELRELNTQVTTEEQQLKAASDDFKLATVRERESKAQEEQAQQELFQAQKELRHARRDLRADTEQLDAAKERKLDAESKARQAESELDRANSEADKAREELQADTSKQVEEVDKKIEEKEGEKTDAEGKVTDAKSRLNDLVRERDTWKGKVETAGNDLKTAWDDWKKAERDLKTFLEQELRDITHKITIELTAEDAAIGQWRTGDNQPIKREIKVQYDSSRIPVVIPPDDDLSQPPGTSTDATCKTVVDLEKAAGIAVGEEPQKSTEPVWGPHPEPQTIALRYKEGEPLYDKWPKVIEESGDKKVMQRAAWPWKTSATDNDSLSATCKPGGGKGLLVGGGSIPASGGLESEFESPSQPQACKAGNALGTQLVDLTETKWGVQLYSAHTEERVYMKVPDLPNGCNAEMDVKVIYIDPGHIIKDDDEDKTSKKFKRFAGMKGDASEKENDFGYGNKVELLLQIFDGAHKGLPDETVKWKVTDYKPEDDSGGEKNYGLTGDKKQEHENKTDDDGYARVDFVMEDKWGIAEVEAKWMRDSACETQKIIIERPLSLHNLKVGFAPSQGWKEAKELFGSTGQADFEKIAKELPDSPEGKVIFATGLLDSLNDPVDGKKILFSVEKPGGVSMDPEEVETEVYGLAWSFAGETPEDAELEMLAKIEEKLKDVTFPPELDGKQSTRTTNRFRIGSEGNYLTIETNEEFVPGSEAISGTGKLVVSGNGVGIPAEFETLELEYADITFDDDSDGDEAPIARGGTVSWDAAKAGVKPFGKDGFSMELEKLGITAGNDGTISGKVTVRGDEENKVDFSAIIGPKGFLGTLSNFPELKLGGFKLKQGASVVIDFHDEKNPSPKPENWTADQNGLLIKNGEILLPESMKGKSDTPPAITFKDVYINSSGLNGKIGVEYAIRANLGNMAFSIESFELELAQSKPQNGTIKGAATFPDPFIGEVKAEVMVADDNYRVSIKTDQVVNAPRLGLAFKLIEATGEYKEEVFSFELSAALSSENFNKKEGGSDIVIRRFKFNSNGDIEAEEIQINQDVEFGRGFKITLNTIGFKKTEDEFKLSLSTGFQFGSVLTAEEVAVSIATGPVVEEFELKIKVNRKPVTVDAGITYKANLFEGTVDVDIEKLFGIKGVFVIGASDNNGDPYQFWYVELNSDVAIPLGQTGLSILELGGGVGYNYDPPIGSAEGAARKTDTMSIKASIAMGNVPRGQVFKGRVALVLVSGRFSVNGKVWLLTKEESLYGEGQLNVYWDPKSKLDGFVRMVTALPGADGKLMNFTGQIGFRFEGPNNWEIKSRQLEGSVLQRILANGNIEVRPGEAKMDGNIRYDLAKEQSVGVGTLKVQVNLRADGNLAFTVTESLTSVDARVSFNGNWDVNLETRVKDFDIVSGRINALLALKARNQRVEVEGSLRVSWDTWVHSGSRSVDIGYTNG